MRRLPKSACVIWPCIYLIVLGIFIGHGFVDRVVSGNGPPAIPVPAVQPVTRLTAMHTEAATCGSTSPDRKNPSSRGVDQENRQDEIIVDVRAEEPAAISEILLMIHDASGNRSAMKFFLAEKGFFDQLNPTGLQIHFWNDATAADAIRFKIPVLSSVAGNDGMNFKF